MFDLFLHCIHALHIATIFVLDLSRNHLLHTACPSWKPKMLELPLPPPTNSAHWLWQWLAEKPLINQLLQWFFASTPSPIISTNIAVVEDASIHDWSMCKWMASLPESSEYSSLRQIYFVVQLTILCWLLYPVLFLVQAAFHQFWPLFRRLSFNSQRYAVLNLGKAAMLACMAASVTWLNAVQEVLLENNSVVQKSLTITIIQSTLFYVAIDLLAIFMVPKLPRSTTMHHVCTVAFAFVVAALDVQYMDTARMILIYGSLSTIAYLVNAFLAIHKVYRDVDDKVMLNRRRLRYLAAFALLIYAIECCFNWSIQLRWYMSKVSLVFEERDYTHIVVPTIYMAVMLSVLVRDDLILGSSLFSSASVQKSPAAPESPLQQVIETIAAIKSKEMEQQEKGEGEEEAKQEDGEEGEEGDEKEGEEQGEGQEEEADMEIEE